MHLLPHFRAIYSEHEITDQQWRVLRYLHQERTSNLNMLSEKTVILAPSLVGVVDRLEKRGLVSRNRNPENRRLVSIEITAKGDALIESAEPKIAKLYERLFEALPQEAWSELYSGLSQIRRFADKLELGK